jgi:hypothetical protein
VPSECSGFAAKASSGCHDNAIFLRHNRIGHYRIHRLGRRAMQAGSWEQPRRLHHGHCRRLEIPKLSPNKTSGIHTDSHAWLLSGSSHYLTPTFLPLLSRQLGLHHTEAHTIRQPQTVTPSPSYTVGDFHSGPSTFVLCSKLVRNNRAVACR